jgi:hypothetical protein
MMRRMFLTAALDRLVEEGEIRRRSNAFRVMKLVIENGVTVLTENQRNLYEEQLIPKIERVALYEPRATNATHAA